MNWWKAYAEPNTVPENTRRDRILVTETFLRLALHFLQAAPGPLHKWKLRESAVEAPPPKSPDRIVFPCSWWEQRPPPAWDWPDGIRFLTPCAFLQPKLTLRRHKPTFPQVRVTWALKDPCALNFSSSPSYQWVRYLLLSVGNITVLLSVSFKMLHGSNCRFNMSSELVKLYIGEES